MGIFDLFKKKSKPQKDFTNLSPEDLDVGYIFDYDLATWTVDEVYIYDWGNNHFSKEYQVNNGKYTAYLSIEDDDELTMSMTKKLKIRSVEENLPEYIIKNQKPPAKINFQGIELLLDKENPGYFKNILDDEDSWEEFISWTYYDKSEDFILTIEQWDINSFEASFGKIVKYFQISNIFPNPNSNYEA